MSLGTLAVRALSTPLFAAPVKQRSIPLPLANVPIPPPPPLALTGLEGSALHLGASLDRRAVALGGDGRVRLELTLKADAASASAARMDSDFVVVLDRSGSMEGERMAQAKQAVLALLEQLQPGDRFALVTYDSGAEVSIPLAPASASARQAWRDTVASISLGGGTNMSAGLDAGLEVLDAARANRPGRLVLLSDGHANMGESSPESLRARGRAAAQRELVLSTIGIGEGFNEYLMTQLADAGTGNYHYLAQSAQLPEIFERELASTRATVASGLAVQIAPAAGVQVIDAAGYPLEHGPGGAQFKVGSLFAGQERRIWVSLNVPVDRAAQHALGEVQVTFTEAGTRKQLALAEPLAVACVVDPQVALASVDKGAWERAVVQEQWGAVQEQVALAVHEGKREEALRVLKAYRADTAPLNASIGSAAVSASLTQSELLERSVADSFEGPDQASKQNIFSKQQQANGRMGRRMGSYF